MKHIFFSFAWILLSVGVILTSVAGYNFWMTQKELNKPREESPVVISAAYEQEQSLLTEKVKGVESVVETEDSRAFIVARFLERYQSPLEPYDYFGQVFIEIADKYNLDFRLLPAIAMQESNLCKSVPPGTFNCLGFGIHERGTLGFDNYEAGFERAAKEIKANYVDIGLTTPQEIMTKYTPHSNGSWAESVNQWMAEMRYNDRELGRELKTDANVLEFTEEEPEATDSPT